MCCVSVWVMCTVNDEMTVWAFVNDGALVDVNVSFVFLQMSCLPLRKYFWIILWVVGDIAALLSRCQTGAWSCRHWRSSGLHREPLLPIGIDWWCLCPVGWHKVLDPVDGVDLEHSALCWEGYHHMHPEQVGGSWGWVCCSQMHTCWSSPLPLLRAAVVKGFWGLHHLP